MQQLLINPNNALNATEYLLDLNLQDIDDRYQQDAHFWISNLQQALQLYKIYLQKNSQSMGAKFEPYEIQRSLQSLSHYANSLFHILTPYAKQALTQCLFPPLQMGT